MAARSHTQTCCLISQAPIAGQWRTSHTYIHTLAADMPCILMFKWTFSTNHMTIWLFGVKQYIYFTILSSDILAHDCNYRKTNGPPGHFYTPINTYVSGIHILVRQMVLNYEHYLTKYTSNYLPVRKLPLCTTCEHDMTWHD